MAALTSKEQHASRRRLANRAGEIRWTKAQANTLMQALEDEYMARIRALLRTTLDLAGTGLALTNAERDMFIETFMRQRDERGRGVESVDLGAR